LGSMEGAVLGGKLAAEAVSRKAKGMEPAPFKEIVDDVVEKAGAFEPRKPPGVKGEGAIAFGGGAQLKKENADLLREVDPNQFEAADVSYTKSPAKERLMERVNK
jgi:15-cis-phytoene desaturase